MEKRLTSRVQAAFQAHHGVAARRALRVLGVTQAMERAMVRSGEWDRPADGVIRLVGAPRTAEQALMIAILSAGLSGLASHESAAWLWRLAPLPRRHTITVDKDVHRRIRGVTVHRLTDSPVVTVRQGIPCTNPLRTLVDLAATADTQLLDNAVDQALAARLVTMEGLHAEIRRLQRQGRRGVGRLRSRLKERGLIGGPAPSVLESRTLRVLRQGGIVPLSREIKMLGDRYRIDFGLDEDVLMEVDGYAHHSSPEQKAYDDRRRNEIRLSGKFLLVYDWVAITRDGRRVVAECREALSRYGTRRRPTG